ncbi:MAG: DUF4105 domain-containing protein [Bacteroidaceae bacterium]|nr:DUF4105 domain-containing protein [Bacteroidaceae bacterium]
MRRLCLLLAVLCSALMLRAQTAGPSAIVPDSTLTVSLLTCSPGQEVYELYGHTALRVRSSKTSTDVVFNYGVFSFDQPHFVWRFVLGQCDYLVAPCDFDLFMYEYRRRGSSVTEQVLNLSEAEANALAHALIENCRPDKRTYRYNFLTNNCTTKARDIIEANIDGEVLYPERAPRYTFRQLIHQFTVGHPWAQEGNDLLLGVDMDTLVTPRAEMFSPIYMMHYADSAMISSFPNRYRPLVRQTNILLAANAEAAAADAARQPSFPLTPVQLGWVLLLLSVALVAWEQHRGRALWGFDVAWMLLQGLAGVLVSVMLCWSTHPGVSSNWLFVVLNPLPLLALPLVVRSDIRGRECLYHRGAALVLTLFLVAVPFAKQKFSALVVLLALCLLSRAVSHLLLYRKVKSERVKSEK